MDGVLALDKEKAKEQRSIAAHVDVIEAQKRGHLHCHLLVCGWCMIRNHVLSKTTTKLSVLNFLTLQRLRLCHDHSIVRQK